MALVRCKGVPAVSLAELRCDDCCDKSAGQRKSNRLSDQRCRSAQLRCRNEPDVVLCGRSRMKPGLIGYKLRIEVSAMSLQERNRLLERLQEDKGKIALDPSEVRSIDQMLAGVWGITVPGPVPSWEGLLPRSASRPAITRYNKAHDEVAEAMARRDKRAKAAALARLYDALADPTILGPVTSQRRHLILD